MSKRPRGFSENLSVALCFRRVSRGNAARRSSQATEAVLSSTLPVSATLLIAPFHRAFSKGKVGRHFRGGEKKEEKRVERERLKERGISVANCRRELPPRTLPKCHGSREKIHMRDDAHPTKTLLTVHRNDDSFATTRRLSMRQSNDDALPAGRCKQHSVTMLLAASGR